MTTPKVNLRARAEAFVTARWYGKAGALKLLWPFEWLYIKVSEAKKKQALSRAMKCQRPRLPTMVVGNLVVGGTGKTPIVIELVAQLEALGAEVGVVTRGYGGSSACWPLLVTPDSDPQVCGDEAVELVIATGCPVVAGPNRCASIAWLAQNTNCTHVVSDDGLQHYAMVRELEVVLVDAERRFGNGHRLPVGPLREPVSRLAHADLVVLTSRTLEEADAAKVDVQNWLPDAKAPVLGSALVPSNVQALFSEDLMAVEDAPFAHADCIALTGIGSPERFHKDLEALGCRVIPKSFADHQDYSLLVASGLLEQWLQHNWVATTGKDAVKLRALLRALLRAQSNSGLERAYQRLWVLQRQVTFADSERATLTELLSRFVVGGSSTTSASTSSGASSGTSSATAFSATAEAIVKNSRSTGWRSTNDR